MTSYLRCYFRLETFLSSTFSIIMRSSIYGFYLNLSSWAIFFSRPSILFEDMSCTEYRFFFIEYRSLARAFDCFCSYAMIFDFNEFHSISRCLCALHNFCFQFWMVSFSAYVTIFGPIQWFFITLFGARLTFNISESSIAIVNRLFFFRRCSYRTFPRCVPFERRARMMVIWLYGK